MVGFVSSVEVEEIRHQKDTLVKRETLVMIGLRDGGKQMVSSSYSIWNSLNQAWRCRFQLNGGQRRHPFALEDPTNEGKWDMPQCNE